MSLLRAAADLPDGSRTRRLRERGIEFVIAKAHLPLRVAVIRLGLRDVLSAGNYFPKLSEAVTADEQQHASKG